MYITTGLMSVESGFVITRAVRVRKAQLTKGVYTLKSLTDKVRELLTEAGDKCGLVQLKQHHFSMDDIDIVMKDDQ